MEIINSRVEIGSNQMQINGLSKKKSGFPLPDYNLVESSDLIDPSYFETQILDALNKDKKVTESNLEKVESLAKRICTLLNQVNSTEEELGDVAYDLKIATNLSINKISDLIFNSAGNKSPPSKSWLARLINDAERRRRDKGFGEIKGVTRRLSLAPLLDNTEIFNHVITSKEITLDDFETSEKRAKAEAIFKGEGVKHSFSITDGSRQALSRLCNVLADKTAKNNDPEKNFTRVATKTIFNLRKLHELGVVVNVECDLFLMDEEHNRLLIMAEEIENLMNNRNSISDS